jgi:hypothetical protein
MGIDRQNHQWDGKKRKTKSHNVLHNRGYSDRQQQNRDFAASHWIRFLSFGRPRVIGICLYKM